MVVPGEQPVRGAAERTKRRPVGAKESYTSAGSVAKTGERRLASSVAPDSLSFTPINRFPKIRAQRTRYNGRRIALPQALPP